MKLARGTGLVAGNTGLKSRIVNKIRKNLPWQPRFRRNNQQHRMEPSFAGGMRLASPRGFALTPGCYRTVGRHFNATQTFRICDCRDRSFRANAGLGRRSRNRTADYSASSKQKKFRRSEEFHSRHESRQRSGSLSGQSERGRPKEPSAEISQGDRWNRQRC